mgnify:CR=1 FL=1
MVQANIAIGSYALDALGANAAEKNIAIGYQAGSGVTTGDDNTIVGYRAGQVTTELTTGIDNTLIGSSAITSAVGSNNQTVIGRGAVGKADNSVMLGNTSVKDVYIAGMNSFRAESDVLYVGSATSADANTALQFRTSDAPAINVDSSQAVTMPSQPSFSVKPASTQTNFATGSDVTVVFGTETWDQGGDFASNTFTAPATGKYALHVMLRIEAVDSAANYYQVKIITSNRNYNSTYDPENGGTDRAYQPFHFSVVADMDTSDTAYVVVNQNGGTQQSDVGDESYFSGFLAC